MKNQTTAGKNTAALLGIFLFSVLSLAPQPASAGVISITTAVTTNVLTENVTTASLQLTNSGNEAAYEVQASLLLPEGFESNPVFVGQLSPNEPFEGNFTITLTGDVNKGKYPLAVLVAYKDANGYPFSSISSSNIVYGTPTASKIFGTISELSVGENEEKRMSLVLGNLGESPHDTRVKLILPAEFRVVEGLREISVPPKEKREVHFDVTNLAGLEGSTYAIFASIEYDDGGLHYTSFAMSVIKIRVGTGPIKLPDWLLLVVIVVLVVIFIYYQFRGKK